MKRSDHLDSDASHTRLRRAEFPYHSDANDLMSRRRFLEFIVYTSGALFAGTALLAILGAIQRSRHTGPQPIARTADIPEGQAFYFHYPDSEDEAVLLHLPGGRYVAYSQRCTHLACSVYYQPQQARLYCPCHEGVFDPSTGEPLMGPPERRLAQIRLRRDGDMLLAEGMDL